MYGSRHLTFYYNIQLVKTTERIHVPQFCNFFVCFLLCIFAVVVFLFLFFVFIAFAFGITPCLASSISFVSKSKSCVTYACLQLKTGSW